MRGNEGAPRQWKQKWKGRERERMACEQNIQ